VGVLLAALLAGVLAVLFRVHHRHRPTSCAPTSPLSYPAIAVLPWTPSSRRIVGAFGAATANDIKRLTEI
jgi:hypothetical protein